MKIDVKEYWSNPPPEPSPKLTMWLSRIEKGWRPNRRISAFGYHEAAEFYGVYIWEYINVIFPALSGHRSGYDPVSASKAKD